MPEALYSENVGKGRTYDAFEARGLPNKLDHGDAQQSVILPCQRVGRFSIPKTPQKKNAKHPPDFLHFKEMKK